MKGLAGRGPFLFRLGDSVVPSNSRPRRGKPVQWGEGQRAIWLVCREGYWAALELVNPEGCNRHCIRAQNHYM